METNKISYHLISEIKSNERRVKINVIGSEIERVRVRKIGIPIIFCHKSKSRKSIIFEDKIIFRLVHGNFRTSSRIVIKKIDIISHGSSIGYTNESRSTRNGDFHGGLGKKKVRERGWVWSIGIANYSGGAGEKTNNDGNNGRITVMC